MITIKASQIKSDAYVCPYCMGDVSIDQLGCCGESSAHFESAIVTIDGNCYLESEVIIEEDQNENT